MRQELITSATTLGALLGGLAGGIISDVTGRKWVLGLADIIFIGGAIGQAVSKTVAQMIGGRFVIGVSGGGQFSGSCNHNTAISGWSGTCGLHSPVIYWRIIPDEAKRPPRDSECRVNHLGSCYFFKPKHSRMTCLSVGPSHCIRNRRRIRIHSWWLAMDGGTWRDAGCAPAGLPAFPSRISYGTTKSVQRTVLTPNFQLESS